MPISERKLKQLRALHGAREVSQIKKALIPKGTRVIKPLSTKTNITKMGLPASVVKKLSPAAKRLTKADLITMSGGKQNSKTRVITVSDMTIIRDAFTKQLIDGGQLAMDIYCCCCPCCCATAVTEPEKQVA